MLHDADGGGEEVACGFVCMYEGETGGIELVGCV